MDRSQYFEKLANIPSPLLLLSQELVKIYGCRYDDGAHNDIRYLAFANKLAQCGTAAAITRAAFIKMQCAGADTHAFFEQHRESWGIPKFQEDLVTAADFRKGFLWCFRDHTSAWEEEKQARDWFFQHVEGFFARHYEYWSSDHGPAAVFLRKSGDYKEILLSLIAEQDYGALVSPVFSREELEAFYNGFDEDEGNLNKEDLLAIIAMNPNW